MHFHTISSDYCCQNEKNWPITSHKISNICCCYVITCTALGDLCAGYEGVAPCQGVGGLLAQLQPGQAAQVAAGADHSCREGPQHAAPHPAWSGGIVSIIVF